MDRQQVISLYFEMSKHFTTLNTAAILVFLAANEEVSIPLWVSLYFVASLVRATIAMFYIARDGLPERRFAPVYFGLNVAILGFLGGVVFSLGHAILLP